MSDKTRNEWQKRWLLSPLYRPLSPPYGIALCYISFIFHQLVQLLNFIMIFNAILSVNHLVIYTQFNNLLFPRKSCSIGFPYPLESIHPVRKPNVVIFAHCPLLSATPHMVRLVGILLISTVCGSHIARLFCEPFQ